MNINHRPMFDIEKATKLYSEKDGVPVKYVCTSATNAHASFAADIFYRETPHPEFGNRYFGLYRNPYANDFQVMITDADNIEKLDFDMIEKNGIWYYSQHRHDFFSVGGTAIDGGRSYLRLVGDVKTPTKRLVIRNGEFVEKTDEVS